MKVGLLSRNPKPVVKQHEHHKVQLISLIQTMTSASFRAKVQVWLQLLPVVGAATS
jgi:hypothetical protein